MASAPQPESAASDKLTQPTILRRVLKTVGSAAKHFRHDENHNRANDSTTEDHIQDGIADSGDGKYQCDAHVSAG
jgi:hypothetical protein